jgi:hypothetical protein
VAGSSEVKPRSNPRNEVSVQAQLEKCYSQSAGRENLTGPITPGTALEPLASPSTLPVIDGVLGSIHKRLLTIRKRQIPPGQILDPNIETAPLGTSFEGTPKHRQVAINNDDPIFLRPSKLGHLTDPPSDEEDED